MENKDRTEEILASKITQLLKHQDLVLSPMWSLKQQQKLSMNKELLFPEVEKRHKGGINGIEFANVCIHELKLRIT